MTRTEPRKSSRKQKWLLAFLIVFGLAVFHVPLTRLVYPNSLEGRLQLEAWLIEHRLRGNPVVLSQLYPYRWDQVIIFNPYEYANFEIGQDVFQHYYGFASPVTRTMLAEGGNQFLIFRRDQRTVRVAPNKGSVGYLIANAHPVSRENAMFTYYRNPVTDRPAFGIVNFD